MVFCTKKLVQFSNCDPFGIVFYPQYFYICSEAKEEFFLHIGHPHFHYINELKLGWPMVKLETEFLTPTRFGETISINISLSRIGISSLGINYKIFGSDQLARVDVKTVVVLTSLDSKEKRKIPDDLRDALQPYLNN